MLYWHLLYWHVLYWHLNRAHGYIISGSFAKNDLQRGYRDSVKLLRELCWPTKWGATRVKILDNKAGKSRISHRVSSGGSGSTRTVDAGHKYAPSWNQIQTLKDCLCCYCYCVHHDTHLYRTVTASRAVSNRESRCPPCSSRHSMGLRHPVVVLDRTSIEYEDT